MTFDVFVAVAIVVAEVYAWLMTKSNVRDTEAKESVRVVSNVMSRSSVWYVVRAYKDSLSVAQINLYFLNMAPPIHL